MDMKQLLRLEDNLEGALNQLQHLQGDQFILDHTWHTIRASLHEVRVAMDNLWNCSLTPVEDD